MGRILKVILICSVTLILLSTSIETGFAKKSMKMNLVSQFEIGSINKNKLDYIKKSTKQYENDTVYKIEYPIFVDDAINKIINTYIIREVFEFRSLFFEYKGKSKDDKKEFNMNINTGIFGGKLLFIEMNINKHFLNYKEKMPFYKTYIVDVDTKNEIHLEEFIDYGYRQIMYNEAKKYYKNIYEIDTQKDENIYMHINPEATNYLNLFYSDNNFYTQIYDIKKDKKVSLKVGILDMLPYINDIYKKNIKILPLYELEKINKNTKFVKEKNTIRNIEKNKPMVALTFDDGPNKGVTNKILDTLEEYNSVATFFVVGERINKEKNTLKRIVELENQIGNHTYGHKDLTKISTKSIIQEIDIMNKNIQNITGKMPYMFRPPYGKINEKIKKDIKAPFIMWNIDTKDWQSRNSQNIKKEALKNVQDGDIILMHDLYDATAKAIEEIVPELIKMGYTLVTLEELFHYKGIDIQDGKVYYNAR